ncbi:desulforedoxin [Chloroflexota bacterium]
MGWRSRLWSKESEKYRCDICGNEVVVTEVGGGILVCYDEGMEETS